MEIKDVVAVYSATVATVLGAVKLWELWRDRLRLEVSPNLRGDLVAGNDILVRNFTSTPVTVTHWELLLRSP